MNRVKRQPTKWEKMLANYIAGKELIPKISEDLLQLIEKINNLIKKCANVLSTHFFSKRKHKWIYKKILNVTNYDGKQRNMKYQLIFVRMAIIKTKDKCWIDCGETETLAFCW